MVNGVATATVDLSNPTWTSPQVLWSRTWSEAARRTIKVQVVRPKVEIDGFVRLD
jgi:hypothetical protein